MTQLIIVLLINIGLLNSPEYWATLTSQKQAELMQIVIDDLEVN